MVASAKPGRLIFFVLCRNHYEETRSRKGPSYPGQKRHGPANFLAGGEQLGPANSLKHGSFAFKKITRLGLQPHHLCVDFGCGSLRIGQHLIGYLKSGRYIGLDITDRFIRDGLDLLDTGMLQAKDPKIHVINEPILQAVTQMKPDYIICVSVLMHVPPHELDAFFDRILRLMTSQTTLLLFFDESSSPIRTEAKSWAYSVASSQITYVADFLTHGSPLNQVR
ncbi:MAG: class I SAM-dependent methyltransferase [Nitrospirales bacterium]|nr:class I SAM-dependent methyltransferase [Nitrospirales bacterium]